MTITDTEYDSLYREILDEVRRCTIGVVGIAVLGNDINASADAMVEATKILENELCQNMMNKMCIRLKQKSVPSMN